jgi:hypothetical protein
LNALSAGRSSFVLPIFSIPEYIISLFFGIIADSGNKLNIDIIFFAF